MGRDMTAVVEQALGGQYKLEREVGRGGNARVFRAQDPSGRTVALKVLHPELLTSVAADRFLREIRVVSQLSHPHIAPLLGSGEAGWLVYCVMPFVEGPTLKEAISRGPLSIPDGTRLADELLDALEHAHAKGFVHRDVKHDNVMLSPDGGAVLLDFGIARAVQAAGADKLTASGIAVGTSTYMSPEQIGALAELDHRSDLYSLGCLLFEALTGRPPFTGLNDMVVIRQHLQEPAPDIRTIRADVPVPFATAIARALSKRAEDRWPSARAMQDAIRNGA